MHVNRFDLLRMLVYAEIAVVGCCIAYAIWTGGIILVILALAFATDLARTGISYVLNELKACSERYEDRRAVRPSAPLIALAERRKRLRILNLIFIMSGIFDFVIRTTVTDTAPPVPLAILQFSAPTMFYLFAHAWDSDDLDPRDRINLFEPQAQRESA